MSTNANLLKKIDPLYYFDQFLSEGVYPDGRETVQFRSLSIEQSIDSKSYGSAYVQQDGASVTCNVNLSVEPISDDPPIVFDLISLECVDTVLVDEARAHLIRIISQGKFFDTDLLKIDKSESEFSLCFTLHLKIIIFSADGFLISAVLSAVQAAILSTSLPRVHYSGNSIIKSDSIDFDDIELKFDISKLEIKPYDENEKKKFLTLNDFLVHVSFLLYSSTGSKKTFEKFQLLCDPPLDLRNLIPNRCDITIGKNGDIYSLNINACQELKDYIFDDILRISKRRHSSVLKTIEKCQKKL